MTPPTHHHLCAICLCQTKGGGRWGGRGSLPHPNAGQSVCLISVTVQQRVRRVASSKMASLSKGRGEGCADSGVSRSPPHPCTLLLLSSPSSSPSSQPQNLGAALNRPRCQTQPHPTPTSPPPNPKVFLCRD